MNDPTINWLAVVVATLVFYALGALWYSPLLFVKAWMKEIGMVRDENKKPNMVKIMGLTLVLTFLMVTNLAFFISDPSISAGKGALYGFLTGFGWVTLSIALLSLYENKSLRYILINGGYITLGFTLAGLILGAWK